MRIVVTATLTAAFTAGCDAKLNDTAALDELSAESDANAGADADPEADDGPPPVAGSVDEACGTNEYGYGSPSMDAMMALERTHCYRRIMGIELGELDADLDRASQSHSDYMHRHDTLTHWQDDTLGGFTGEWVWDRMESAGFDVEAGQSWAEVVSWGTSPTEAVDMWVGSVYHRIPLTAPYWIALGYGQTGDYSSMSFVSPYPDGPRTAVVFPVHGQTQVPARFDSDTEWPDPAPNHGVVGYPISVTVAAENTGSDYANPYDTAMTSASLTDAAGTELAIIELDPTTDSDMSNMVAIVPVEPFENGETYTATMSVRWDGSEETFTTTFTVE